MHLLCEEVIARFSGCMAVWGLVVVDDALRSYRGVFSEVILFPCFFPIPSCLPFLHSHPFSTVWSLGSCFRCFSAAVVGWLCVGVGLGGFGYWLEVLCAFLLAWGCYSAFFRRLL